MMADMHNRAARLEQALNPKRVKIDGRDNRDRLAFVASFARLIQYYDQHNRLAGNWQAFFMKDPAILLAAISKTDYEHYHTEFMLLDQGSKQGANGDSDFVFVNRLCRLMKEIFFTINHWVRLMDLGASAHSLHLFLKKKIKDTLAGQLALMIALQQRLSIATRGVVVAPDVLLYRGLDPVWREPLVGLPGIATSDATVTRAVIKPYVAALRRIYHIVFDVFVQAIEHATQAFYQQETLPTRYPDTALLIAFSRLMETQQAEINKLSEQHLDFYYDRVLRQTPRGARPDQAVVCLTLADKVEAFSLAAGTAFKAGTYPDQSAILFCNESRADLNRAAISSACTLYCDPGAANAGALYRNDIANPSQVVRNALQEIVSWDGFGNDAGQPVPQGFALASPMLLLQGGQRTITLSFTFVGDPPALLEGSQCYLSTADGWFAKTPNQGSSANTIILQLQPGDPAIVAFAKGPDGYTSAWPMFKMMLGKSIDLSRPPMLTQIAIQVEVDGFSRFSMANDAAPLSDTGPQPLFGPVPDLGSRFYVGSNECFAKPLTSLALTLAWDNPPGDFCTYYSSYNQYLQTLGQAPAFNNAAFTGAWSLLSQKSWQPLSAAPSVTPPDPHPHCTVNPIPMFQQGANQSNASVSAFTFCLPALPPSPALALAPLAPVQQASDGYIRLALESPGDAFGADLYAKVVSYVSLKNAETLIHQAMEASSVLAKIGTLISDAFAAVKAAITKWVAGLIAKVKALASKFKDVIKNLFNRIFKPGAAKAPMAAASAPAAAADGATPSPPPVFLPTPNLPYVPRVSVPTATYAASVSSVIGAVPAEAPIYPMELYHYGSFKPYLAYDAASPGNALGFLNLTPRGGSAGPASNPQLPLFTGVSGQGCLYVSFRDVRPPCVLGVYAEISADTSALPPDHATLGFYYWTREGWRPIAVVHDDTGNLTRSGIIKFEVPEMTAAQPSSDENTSFEVCPIMPNKDFWIAIATEARGINIKISYLNTQPVKLTRMSMAALPVGETPSLAANSIAATQNQVAQITAVVQAFPSFGGQPAEDTEGYGGPTSFYRRVSARLNNKDRCVTAIDIVETAHAACAGLYHARVLASEPGIVRIGLVNGYANAQLPNAFRPVVGGQDQNEIRTRIAARVSAQTNLQVSNLKHQVVTITVKLRIAPNADEGAMKATLNQSLRIYLSPWISSDGPRAALSQTVNRAALIGFLAAQKDVLSVVSLDLAGDGAPDDGTILVSAVQHTIALVAEVAAHA